MKAHEVIIGYVPVEIVGKGAIGKHGTLVGGHVVAAPNTGSNPRISGNISLNEKNS